MNDELFERGLALRKRWLGDEYVAKALGSADELDEPLQRLITEYCWGAMWAREGLPLKTKSLLNLAMFAAMNRPHELAIHLRGAIRNGITQDEIREVLLQVAIYCGMPAAVDAFRVARAVLEEPAPAR